MWLPSSRLTPKPLLTTSEATLTCTRDVLPVCHAVRVASARPNANLSIGPTVDTESSSSSGSGDGPTIGGPNGGRGGMKINDGGEEELPTDILVVKIRIEEIPFDDKPVTEKEPLVVDTP